MSDLFQLLSSDGHAGSSNPFHRFDLSENPFPPAGLESDVLYPEHMKNELKQVDQWIREVASDTDTDTDTDKRRAAPIRPLAVYGSLGAGKTHLLRTLERGLSRNQATPVLRKGLADEGMTRLVLANLFLRYLPLHDAEQEPGTGLIRKLVHRAREDKGRREAMFDTLRGGGPVLTPFRALLRTGVEDNAVVWMSRWLRREYTTPAQRAKLGVAGVLQSEGEAVRAVADLLRLARAAGIVRVWFVMIDQMEELWRPGVITSSRRARFLTDLRHLVDHALEGAPIALLLAWNTTVDQKTLFRGGDVAAQMDRDYPALWQRLGAPVNLPPLATQHVWPFAAKYLDAAGVNSQADEARRTLFTALQSATEEVLHVLDQQQKSPKTYTYAPRKVLQAWRDKALVIAQSKDVYPSGKQV